MLGKFVSLFTEENRQQELEKIQNIRANLPLHYSDKTKILLPGLRTISKRVQEVDKLNDYLLTYLTSNKDYQDAIKKLSLEAFLRAAGNKGEMLEKSLNFFQGQKQISTKYLKEFKKRAYLLEQIKTLNLLCTDKSYDSKLNPKSSFMKYLTAPILGLIIRKTHQGAYMGDWQRSLTPEMDLLYHGVQSMTTYMKYNFRQLQKKYGRGLLMNKTKRRNTGKKKCILLNEYITLGKSF